MVEVWGEIRERAFFLPLPRFLPEPKKVFFFVFWGGPSFAVAGGSPPPAPFPGKKNRKSGGPLVFKISGAGQKSPKNFRNFELPDPGPQKIGRAPGVAFFFFRPARKPAPSSAPPKSAPPPWSLPPKPEKMIAAILFWPALFPAAAPPRPKKAGVWTRPPAIWPSPLTPPHPPNPKTQQPPPPKDLSSIFKKNRKNAWPPASGFFRERAARPRPGGSLGPKIVPSPPVGHPRPPRGVAPQPFLAHCQSLRAKRGCFFLDMCPASPEKSSVVPAVFFGAGLRPNTTDPEA